MAPRKRIEHNLQPFETVYNGRDRKPYAVEIGGEVCHNARTARRAARWIAPRQLNHERFFIPEALADGWYLHYDVRRDCNLYPHGNAWRLTRNNTEHRYNSEGEARRAHARLTSARKPPSLLASLWHSLWFRQNISS